MQIFRSISPRLAKTMLAAPPEQAPPPTLDDMGRAALAFVQRFDMRRVLGDFEKELMALAAEAGQGAGAMQDAAAVAGGGPGAVGKPR